MEIRYAVHPSDFKSYTTEMLRKHFLMPVIFSDDRITQYYSHYDRLIVGGIKPVNGILHLEGHPELRSEFFLQRRELGIINVGAPGSVLADGQRFILGTKEALYIGRDTREITFESVSGGQALFYYNSAPAHANYPTRHVTLQDAETVELGSQETANHRTIRKLIVNSVVPTCQLQMGLTDLKAGSIWNTMPPHTHSRRMEAYFYFNIPQEHVVCHYLGEPLETRHIWVTNHQAVLSPPWSIHSGAGTSNYSFIWGMAGENLDYSDMDGIHPIQLR